MRRLIIRGIGRFREVGEWGVGSVGYELKGSRRKTSLLPRAGLDAVWSGAGGAVVLWIWKNKVDDSPERHDLPAQNRAWGRARMATLRSNTLRFVRSAISNDITVLSTIFTSSYSTTG